MFSAYILASLKIGPAAPSTKRCRSGKDLATTTFGCLAEPERGNAASIGISGALSFATGDLIASAAGWRAAFLAAAISAAVAWLSVALIVPAQSRRNAPAKDGQGLYDFRPVFRNKSAMAYAIAYCVHTQEMSALRGWGVAFLGYVAATTGAAAARRRGRCTAMDPSVWTGRALQAESAEWQGEVRQPKRRPHERQRPSLEMQGGRRAIGRTLKWRCRPLECICCGAAVADQRAANSTNPSVACRTGRVRANTPMPSRPPSSLVLPSIVWKSLPLRPTTKPVCPCPSPVSMKNTWPGSTWLGSPIAAS